MTGIAIPLADAEVVAWFKSSYSGGEGNECVEVAHTSQGVGIRDSKSFRHPEFTVSASAFAAFVDSLKGVRFAGGQGGL